MMLDFFASLLLKAAETFLITLSSKLAERLVAPKEKRKRKKPTPRRRKQKGKA